MKTQLLKIVAIFFVFVLSSCASSNISRKSLSTEYVSPAQIFRADFKTTWDAAIRSLLKGNNIKTTDEKNGFVNTEFSLVDNREVNPVKALFGGKTYKNSYSLNIARVNNSETKVGVTVNLHMYQRINNTNYVEKNGKVENYLRKKLLYKICCELSDDSEDCIVKYSVNPMEVKRARRHMSSRTARQEPPQTVEYESSPRPFEKYKNKTVILVQQRLIDAGYNPGPVDGKMGKKTRNAIMDFQQHYNLNITGKADRATLATLDKISASSSNGVKVSSVKRKAQTISKSNRTYTTIQVTKLKARKNLYSETLAVVPAKVNLSVFNNDEHWLEVIYNGVAGYIKLATPEQEHIEKKKTSVPARTGKEAPGLAGRDKEEDISEDDIVESESPATSIEDLAEDKKKVELEKEVRNTPRVLVRRYTTKIRTELKSKKSVFSDNIAQIPENSRLDVIGNEENWLEVVYGGLQGFVYLGVTVPVDDKNATKEPVSKIFRQETPSSTVKREKSQEKRAVVGEAMVVKVATRTSLVEEPVKKQEVEKPLGKGVTTQTVKLQKEASVLSETLQPINIGVWLELLSKEGNFYRVKYSGSEGYVYSEFVKMK